MAEGKRRGLCIAAAGLSDKTAELLRESDLRVNVVSEDEMAQERRKIEQSGVKAVHVCTRVSTEPPEAVPAAVLARCVNVPCTGCHEMCRLDPAAGPGLGYVQPWCMECLPVLVLRLRFREYLNGV